MIIVKKIYADVESEDLKFSGALRSITCALKVDFPNGRQQGPTFQPAGDFLPQSNGIYYPTKQLRSNLQIFEIPGNIQLPLYSIRFDIAAGIHSESLAQLQALRTPARWDSLDAEAAVAPIALFQSTTKMSKLLTAGILEELNISYLKEAGKIKGAGVTMTVRDCRLWSEFLARVDLEKLRDTNYTFSKSGQGKDSHSSRERRS